LGAVDSYKEDIIIVIVSLIVIKPLLAALKKLPGIKYPLS
jgi:hypothetical protein